jgi:hypothetical protein
MNPLKMLLLVIVSTGLACSAFAIERTRVPDTPSPAVSSPAAANGGSLVSTANAAVIEPGLRAEANDWRPGTAVVQYAAVDAGRIGVRAASSAGGVTALAAARASAAPSGTGFPAMPEPAEWMQLLCGLVVAGFIARRRTALVSG